MAPNNAATDKPTVSKAMETFGERILPSNEFTGQFTGSMLRFLDEDNVPPYHQVKAHVILAACREETEAWGNIASSKTSLKRAEMALKVAKETYVHAPEDAKHMEFLEESIADEKKALREYEQRYSSDDSEDDDEASS